jgi:hypothetical protein
MESLRKAELVDIIDKVVETKESISREIEVHTQRTFPDGHCSTLFHEGVIGQF